MSAVKKRLSLCLMGNRITRVSEEGFSGAKKGFVPSNTARCNQWSLGNFESWRSQVAVKESFPHNVLLTDDSEVLCSCLCKYVRNTAHCNKWALNDFE